MLWEQVTGLGDMKQDHLEDWDSLIGLASLLNIIDCLAQDEMVWSVLCDGRFCRLSLLFDKQYKGLKKVKR